MDAARPARGARSTRRAVVRAAARERRVLREELARDDLDERDGAPAIAKQTVFAPSQGPACTPWTLRVMIWHPVSSVAVHAPSRNHVACSTQTSRTKGM